MLYAIYSLLYLSIQSVVLLTVLVGCGAKKPPPVKSVPTVSARDPKVTTTTASTLSINSKTIVSKPVEGPQVDEEKVPSAPATKKEQEKKDPLKSKFKEQAKEKQEDSLDALQPRKAEAERAKNVKADEKVANKGDYKTWQGKYDSDDFDKSIQNGEMKKDNKLNKDM